jgi:hypothetical protein
VLVQGCIREDPVQLDARKLALGVLVQALTLMYTMRRPAMLTS